MLKNARQTCIRWKRCEGGSIAVIAGLLVFVVVVSMGLAIDYNRALDLRARLQNAADFAVLAALNPSNTAADVEQAAEDLFRATLAPEDLPLVTNVTATLETDPSRNDRTLSIAFNANLANNFMAIAGYDVTPVGGSASARIGSSGSARFHFLLDTSDSMGLVSTTDGRTRLRAATADSPGGGCQFACHQSGSNSNLSIARRIGVTLRLDVAKMGIERMLDLAQPGGGYSFSLASMSSEHHPITGVTNDPSEITRALDTVDVGYGHPDDDANTLYNITLPSAAAWLDEAGAHGRSDIVVLITDGIQSSNRGEVSPLGLLDIKYCEALKKNGRKLAVIYTKYLPVTGDHMYDAYIAPVYDQIESNLRACASPDLFAKGEVPDEIIKAFEEIFDKAPKTLYLAS